MTVHGKQTDAPGRVYLHRGIAARQFQRSFVIAEGIEVAGASLDKGLLHVDLNRPRPKNDARVIAIKAGDEVDRVVPTIDVTPGAADRAEE